MNCTEARELLLDAEPAELDGAGPSELARHLAGCPECAALARVILDDMQAMDAALNRLATTKRPQRAVPRRPAVRWLAAGLAAAAVLTGILLARREPRWPGTSVANATPGLPRGVEVDLAASTRQAAVFATADSTITVVWFY
jgi:anti-sigma factor RsiW